MNGLSNIYEMNHLSGTVEFACYRSFNHKNDIDPEIYTEKFHTLEELLHLINMKKLKEIKSKSGALEVEIDAITFFSCTPDSEVKVEFLLLKDEFYGQVI